MLGQILITDLKHRRQLMVSGRDKIGLPFCHYSEFKQIGLFSNIIATS